MDLWKMISASWFLEIQTLVTIAIYSNRFMRLIVAFHVSGQVTERSVTDYSKLIFSSNKLSLNKIHISLSCLCDNFSGIIQQGEIKRIKRLNICK